MRRWLSVSTVPPLLLDTTTIVRSSRSPRTRATWCGSVVSSTVSGTPAVRVMTSGASDDPPMPASTTWSRPRVAAPSSASRGSSARDVSGGPSRPSRLLASAVASGPHSWAFLSDKAPGTPSVTSRSSTASASSMTPQVVTETPPAVTTDVMRAAPRRRPRRPWSRSCFVLQFPLDGAEQLVPGRLELLDALVLEHLDHVVVVDPRRRERGHVRAGVVIVGPDRVAVRSAMVGLGVQRRLRHGVDRAGRDQVVDVHRVGVGRILDAGRRPQRALRASAGGQQR